MSRQRSPREWIDKIHNEFWFWTHQGVYRRFLKKVDAAGYDRNDIWYSYTTGFFCWPPTEKEK